MSGLDAVSNWRQGVSQDSHEAVPERLRPTAKVYTACDQLYSKILTGLADQGWSNQSAVMTSLQRSYDSLKIWADGYGVVKGHLDDVLYKSRRASHGTLRLLTRICQTLTKRLFPLIDDDHNSGLHSSVFEVFAATDGLREHIAQDSGDSDSDTESEYLIDGEEDPFDIAADLNTDVQCLLDLGYRFHEQPIQRALKSKGLASERTIPVVSDPLFVILAERIRSRYPSCSQDLVELLGKAQNERIIRCQEDRSRNRHARLAMSSSGETSTSRVAPTIFRDRDSALGSSIPTASRYAETVISYAEGQGGSIRVPPLPEGASRGTPFECVACEKLVTIRSKSAWKRHLFLDLEPYICLDTKCERGIMPLITRTQWENHITSEHSDSIPWEGVSCPICSQETPKGTPDASKHLAGHLEQISLTGLPSSADSEDELDSPEHESSSSLGTANAEQELHTIMEEEILESQYEGLVQTKEAEQSKSRTGGAGGPHIRCTYCQVEKLKGRSGSGRTTTWYCKRSKSRSNMAVGS
ncbi:hypothetical protein PG988_005718 [Apiospora saccharicola]